MIHYNSCMCHNGICYNIYICTERERERGRDMYSCVSIWQHVITHLCKRSWESEQIRRVLQAQCTALKKHRPCRVAFEHAMTHDITLFEVIVMRVLSCHVGHTAPLHVTISIIKGCCSNAHMSHDPNRACMLSVYAEPSMLPSGWRYCRSACDSKFNVKHMHICIYIYIYI